MFIIREQRVLQKPPAAVECLVAEQVRNGRYKALHGL